MKRTTLLAAVLAQVMLPAGAQALDSGGCLSCHAAAPEIGSRSAQEIHALHAGKTARPEADCLQCHTDRGEALEFLV